MSDERTVTRTYRAAIRLGEDFITLEETVSLPINATDAEVQQAVDLGWRIYRAQREAVEQQVETVRSGRPATSANYTPREPDAPASDKQRNYIARLQDDLFWTSEQLAAFAAEQNVDLVSLTKGEASTFIDRLKKLADNVKAVPKPDYGTPPMLAAIAAASGDEPPPPEPNGSDGSDIPF